ncbi:MAG TPA: alpha/beta hydrolase [Thermomicrobiales bacterium]|nr:alpha/beta hydrolase [Thermomicrobiales bacterium]
MAMAVPPTSIRVDGIELGYVEHGTGDPVILVHGSGATDLRTWGSQMEPFAQHYRVIAYSQRYHWPNAWVGDGSDVSSTRQHVADLAGLIHTLRLGPCHIVGSSYGGDIALLLAVEHPGLVRSLVLGEPGLQQWLVELPGGAALSAEQLQTIEPAAQAVQRGDLELATRLFIDVVLGPDIYDQLPPAAHERLQDNARLLGFERPDLHDSPFDCEAAGMITAPTLLLTGDASPAMFGLVAEELTRCMPRIKRALIPNTAHLLHGMNPDAYNATVLAFLAEH